MPKLATNLLHWLRHRLGRRPDAPDVYEWLEGFDAIPERSNNVAERGLFSTRPNPNIGSEFATQGPHAGSRVIWRIERVSANLTHYYCHAHTVTGWPGYWYGVPPSNVGLDVVNCWFPISILGQVRPYWPAVEKSAPEFIEVEIKVEGPPIGRLNAIMGKQ